MLGAAELPRWLAVLARHAHGRVVIVPGGGIFADAVREAQIASKVSDEVAHHLALIAMDQFGLLLAAMNPSLQTVSTALEIAECGRQNKTMIWLPSKMVMADPNVPQHWQVSSDSLSAWLANYLNAEHLVLVKSKSLDSYQSVFHALASDKLAHKSTFDAEEKHAQQQKMMSDGLIDREFLGFTQGKSFKSWILNKADYPLFEQDLSLDKLKLKALYFE